MRQEAPPVAKLTGGTGFKPVEEWNHSLKDCATRRAL